jgi:hypothetical protein
MSIIQPTEARTSLERYEVCRYMCLYQKQWDNVVDSKSFMMKHHQVSVIVILQACQMTTENIGTQQNGFTCISSATYPSVGPIAKNDDV